MGVGIGGVRALRWAAMAVAALLLASAAPASAAQVSRNIRFTTPDGVTLATTLTGDAPLDAPRPVVVEFSPYGANSQTIPAPPGIDLLLVQIRGTGDSDGSFDALGPQTQQDVVDVL